MCSIYEKRRCGLLRFSYSQQSQQNVQGHKASKPTTYIHCLDANNLYDWAMCKPLPIKKKIIIIMEGIDPRYRRDICQKRKESEKAGYWKLNWGTRKCFMIRTTHTRSRQRKIAWRRSGCWITKVGCWTN